MTIISIQFSPRPERKRKQATDFRSSRMARLGLSILMIATTGTFLFGAAQVAHRVTGYVSQTIEQFYLRGSRVPQYRLRLYLQGRLGQSPV